MKHYSPTSKSRRNMTGINYRDFITANEPHKSLTVGGKREVGRGNSGRITVLHKGGGHKRLYRLVDFDYNKFDIPATVETIEYDPNRTGFIALVVYKDGERRYVLAPKNMRVGDTFLVSENAPVATGNRLPLKKLMAGTFVYNIEIHPKGGAKIARSAGNFCEVLASDAGFTSVKMPSGEVRKINENCYATIGAVSNDENQLVKLGKAGRSRWMGIRPKVRGTAMNPVDHPYGGGEGVQGRGTKRPKTRTGKVTGGHKTRTPKKYSNVFIVSRRPSRKSK